MATNLTNSQNNTPQFFNGYYNQTISLNPEIYNQLYAFFRGIVNSESAAKELAQSVMVLTHNNKLDPMKIIQDFNKAASDSELKTLLITFFNSLRGPTSKIGYNNTVYSNQWTQRNIIP